MPDEYHNVLTYWLGQVDSASFFPREKVQMWFRGTDEIDCEIHEQFSTTWKKAAEQQLKHWLNHKHGRLALIIVLDQFTRNLFRNTIQAFSQDEYALQLCLDGIKAGIDLKLYPVERYFFYMPLQHSEKIAIQDASVQKFQELLEDAPNNLKAEMHMALDYAVEHQRIIAQFGRFPHRNQILGRESSKEELLHLESHPGF